MSASEAAQLLAALVEDPAAVPAGSAAELHRLLSSSLARPAPAARRFDRLALLAGLIAERDGLLPTTREYDTARNERSGDAPAASTLIAAYGHWQRALRAAARALGPRAHTPPRPHPDGARGYTARECAAAIARFQRRFATWPSQWEYEQWARWSREAARRCAAPDPRLPATPAIRLRFGTFDRALAAAQVTYGRPGGQPEGREGERRGP